MAFPFTSPEPRLATRLGCTVHVSPLRIRLAKLAERHPSAGASCLEDWLLDVANARGARVVVRPGSTSTALAAPPRDELTDEELVVAICHLAGADRPQMLRLAAQLISRGSLDLTPLIRLAVRERTGAVLAAMAAGALKVAPTHPAWLAIHRAFAAAPPPHDVVIHWSRLAEPVMANGRCNAASWKLVA